MREPTTPYLIIPGWGDSGPEHWQSHWQRELAGAHRVAMSDWSLPRRADWVETLDRAIRAAAAPPILIAHSLGCVAVAHWASAASDPIPPVQAALLVAPADLDRPECPEPLRDFAPLSRRRLPFAVRVVASDNDPYAALPRIRQLAADWGAELTVLSGAGHINADTGFGPWREGRALLDALRAPSPAPRIAAVP